MQIQREYPEGTLLVFANHFTIQASQDEVFFSFFAMTPPDAEGATPEEVGEKLRGMTAKAKCVTRIVLTKEFFPKILATLKQHEERLRRVESPSDAAEAG